MKYWAMADYIIIVVVKVIFGFWACAAAWWTTAD